MHERKREKYIFTFQSLSRSQYTFFLFRLSEGVTVLLTSFKYFDVRDVRVLERLNSFVLVSVPFLLVCPFLGGPLYYRPSSVMIDKITNLSFIRVFFHIKLERMTRKKKSQTFNIRDFHNAIYQNSLPFTILSFVYITFRFTKNKEPKPTPFNEMNNNKNSTQKKHQHHILLRFLWLIDDLSPLWVFI